ncbi:hypothetical protein ES708_22173 [subsurface metagenome]
MKTHSLELKFSKPSKTGLPRLQYNAQIYIKTYTVQQDFKFITPDCVTLREFDYQINRLQKELEDIRKKAKKKFLSVSKKGVNKCLVKKNLKKLF